MENIMEFSNGTHHESNSTSNQAAASLTQPKMSCAPPTKCISFYGLSMFERCFIFLNVCIIVILLPIVFSSIHRLNNITSEINGIKDDNLQQIKGMHKLKKDNYITLCNMIVLK